VIDTKKIKDGIKLPLLIGVGLLVLMYVITIGISFLSAGMDYGTTQIIGIVLLAIPYIFFLPFFIWTGYRSVKKYNVYLVEAGLIAAIVAGLLKIIEFLATFVIVLLLVLLGGGALLSIGDGEIGEAAGSLAAISGIILLAGILMSSITCAIQLAFTIPVNFIVGLVGGYIAGQKKFSEEKKPEKTVAKKPPKRK